MTRVKKSVETMIVEGKTHLTKQEIEKRREEEAALIGSSDHIKLPSFIKDKTAKKEFDRVVAELINLGIVSNLDNTVLAIYCNAFANYSKITEQLSKQDLVVSYTNKAGATNDVENPLIKAQMKYIDVMLKCSNKLGLSISDRLKLVVPKKEKVKDEIEEEFGDI